MVYNPILCESEKKRVCRQNNLLYQQWYGDIFSTIQNITAQIDEILFPIQMNGFRPLQICRQVHPTSIFNFQNIFCKISCLPASPRIFEHLKKAIIAHF